MSVKILQAKKARRLPGVGHAASAAKKRRAMSGAESLYLLQVLRRMGWERAYGRSTVQRVVNCFGGAR